MARIKFFKVNNSLPGAPEADAVYFVKSTVSGDVTQYVTNTAGNASQVGGSGGGGSTLTNTDDLSEGSTNLYHTSGRVTTLIAAAVGVSVQAYSATLAALSALTTTVFGRSLLTQADAGATRTTLGLGTLATQSGSFSGTSSGTNTGDQTITLSGDVTGSGTSGVTTTLANSGASAGSYTNANITVDAKGRVTAVTNGSAGGAPAGSGTELQYRNGSSFAAMSGTAWDDTNRSLTVTGATVTTSKPLFDVSQNWNAGAVAFVGFKINITDTASASTSKIIDLKVGGTTVSSVSKAGMVSARAGSYNNLSYEFGPGSGNGIYWFLGVQFLNGGGVTAIAGTGSGLGGFLSPGGAYGFCAGGSNTADVSLYRNAAGVVEINNGTAGTYRDLRLRNIRTEATTVASLVAAATAGAGARSFVTDATATTFLSTVSGGGANKVPVVSDGTNWLIG